MALEDKKRIESLDPRISRARLSGGNHEDMTGLLHFQTYEVFHQNKRGAQHKHVGIVHAPNSDMALLYAKEQYARREQTANIWVAPSSCISATEYADDDIFTTNRFIFSVLTNLSFSKTRCSEENIESRS